MFVMGFCRLFLAGVVTTWVATEFEEFFSGVVRVLHNDVIVLDFQVR